MNKKGFTLIEVLIATVIMVSALGALVYGLTQCSGLTETVRNRDIALNAVQEKLEEIADSELSKIMEYNDPPNNSFAVVDTQGDDLLIAPPALVNPGQIIVTQIGTTDLYDVTVTVTWQQRAGRQIARSLTTTLFVR